MDDAVGHGRATARRSSPGGGAGRPQRAAHVLVRRGRATRSRVEEPAVGQRPMSGRGRDGVLRRASKWASGAGGPSARTRVGHVQDLDDTSRPSSRSNARQMVQMPPRPTRPRSSSGSRTGRRVHHLGQAREAARTASPRHHPQRSRASARNSRRSRSAPCATAPPSQAGACGRCCDLGDRKHSSGPPRRRSPSLRLRGVATEDAKAAVRPCSLERGSSADTAA